MKTDAFFSRWKSMGKFAKPGKRSLILPREQPADIKVPLVALEAAVGEIVAQPAQLRPNLLHRHHFRVEIDCEVLQAGDIILDVNGTAPNPENASQSLTELINASQGDAMVLGIRRDGERTEITLTPFYDTETGRYRMGIHVSAVASGEMLPVAFGEAVRDSWNVCVNAATIIGQALRDMVTTGAGLNEVGGLVGTVAAVSEQVNTYGFAAFINALVVISINLGIMNLLPIPGLDGARFLFLLVEAIRRKPLPQKKEAIVNLIGMALLFGLMILLVFKDVWTLMGH